MIFPSYLVTPKTSSAMRSIFLITMATVLLLLPACGEAPPKMEDDGSLDQAEKINDPQDTAVKDGARTTTATLLTAEEKVAAKIAGQQPAISTAPKDNSGKAISTVVPKVSPSSPRQKTADKAPVTTVSTFSTGSKNETVAVAAPTIYPSHKGWNQQLQTYVNSRGNVDYVSWKQNEEKLDEYLKILAKETPAKDWPRNEAKAYWLNAYNAFTVKLILRNYPIAKITDLHNGSPWKVKWIELGGNTYGLDQIENEIIRPRYQDARIHFAVNCAAESCPPLYNRAFEATGLDATLNQLTRAFINNDRYNEITARTASISKVFDWYADDFGPIIAYLNHYSNTEIAADAKVSYRAYDWSLNEQ